MYPKVVIDNYQLLDKVYGNYVSFQKKLSKEIKNFPQCNGYINILEIGCGSGITTGIVLSAKKDIRITSIDINPKMIDVCKRSLKNNGNLNLIESDALKYVNSQNDNSFDIVVSGFTIHNFKKIYRRKLYQQLHRILKNNGLFLNADKYVSDNLDKQIKALKYRIGTYADTLIREGQYDFLSYWIRDYIKDIQPEYIMKIREERQLISEHGFSDVSYIFKSEHEMLAIMKAKKVSGHTRTHNSNKNVK